MKLTSPLFSAFALIAPSSACLHLWGEITDTGGTLTTGGISATVIDNGVNVCPGGARIDQDDHFSMYCLPGYVFAITKTASKAWFQNSAGTSWEIDPKPKRTFDCCGGILANGHCTFPCTNYDWDVWLFC
ncbi:hypothetical protein BKA61DRAFT_581332 [Leptodontidium sp. MPI-SDFR-AT-0119]|nr:hypothetical protein BKA61DRAFT_581332 [Leptodontidium sp. MPI-SDFR-AT-0119]